MPKFCVVPNGWFTPILVEAADKAEALNMVLVRLNHVQYDAPRVYEVQTLAEFADSHQEMVKSPNA